MNVEFSLGESFDQDRQVLDFSVDSGLIIIWTVWECIDLCSRCLVFLQ